MLASWLALAGKMKLASLYSGNEDVNIYEYIFRDPVRLAPS